MHQPHYERGGCDLGRWSCAMVRRRLMRSLWLLRDGKKRRFDRTAAAGSIGVTGGPSTAWRWGWASITPFPFPITPI